MQRQSILRQVNNDFYARCAPSFSASRNAPWVGWRSCWKRCKTVHMRLCDGPDVHLYDRATAQPGAIRKGASVRVLDVACGNMRFAAFLREELRGRQIDYFAVDDCAGLVPHLPEDEGFSTCFQNLDISTASLRSALVWRTQSMLNLAIWSDASGSSITFLRSSFACGSSMRFFRRQRRVVLYARRFGNSWATRSL